MTLAAGIEIGVLGSSTAGQGKLAGVASGTGRVEAASAGLLAPIAVAGSAASGAGSFREGLQSLLASLGTSTEEAAVKPADAASTLATDSGSSFNPAAKIESKETGVGVKLSLAAAEIGVSSARTTAGVAKATTGAAKEKEPETEPKKESVKEASTTASAPQAATDAVSITAVSGLLPAAIATPAQPVPVDLSSPPPAVDQPTRTATTSLVPYSSSIDVRGPIDATSRATAQASGNEVGASPSHATNELPSPAISQTSPPDARQEVASSQGDLKNVQQADATVISATRGASTNAPEKTVQGQPASAIAVPRQIPAEPAAVESQSLTLISASSEKPSAVIEQSQDVISMQALKPMDASSPALASGESTDHLAVAASTVAIQSGQPVPMSPVAEKPSSAVSGKGSTVSVSRPARGTGKNDSDLKVSRLVDGQASNSTLDTLAMAREAAGAHGSARPAGEFAQNSTTESASSDSREAFAELDAMGTAGKPTWIHAGTQRAEAGFQDPALGWISVRADTNGGGVHAQLVPGSTDAAQALTGHLAGLNAYLTEHHTPVETLTLTTPDSNWTGPDSDQRQGQNMQQGAGQQTRQDADSGSQSSSSGNSLAQSATSGAAVFQRGFDGSAAPAGAGGIHISVMA
jgi:hypothetical protein